MELGTTSAVISFAIELDAQTQTHYSKVQEATKDTKLLNIVQLLQKRHTKRKKRLQRFRRELVTEMILEPIHGFKREDFELNIQITPKMDGKMILTALLTNEETMKKFFLTAAQKVDFLPELSDQFQLLVEDIEKSIEALKGV